jgi:hypothetical protein
LSICATFGVNAQSLEGNPYVTNFDRYTYKAHNQNWSVVQDNRGVFYFGNKIGLLEYDGIKWSLNDDIVKQLVRSIKKDKNGLLVLGFLNDFGYLSVGKKGKLQFNSLLNLIPEEELGFGEIVKVHCASNGIYFQALSKIFFWDYETIKIYKPENSFHFSFLVDNKFYVKEIGVGLKTIDKNKNLTLIKGGEAFSKLKIYSILPLNSNESLVYTLEDGFYVISKSNEKSPYKIAFESEDLFRDYPVYTAIQMPNSNYAFATLGAGVVITDKKGKIIKIIDEDAGIIGNRVYDLYLDNHQVLWAALDNGISRIDINSPLTFFNSNTGIYGSLESIEKYKGRIFVGTSDGLFYSKTAKEIEDSDFAADVFVKVNGINARCWDLKTVAYRHDTLLMIATHDGLFEIYNNLKPRKIEEGRFYCLHQSLLHPFRVFVGGEGLLTLKVDKGGLVFEDYYEYLEEEVKKIGEDKHGDLWISNPNTGVVRLVNKESEKFEIVGEGDTIITTPWEGFQKVIYYDTLHGLPSFLENRVFENHNEVHIATLEGIMKYDERKGIFVFDTIYGKKYADKSHQVYFIEEINERDIWIASSDTLTQRRELAISKRQKDGMFVSYSMPFKQLSKVDFFDIYVENNYESWLAGSETLIKYNSKVKKDYNIGFQTLIRLVKVGKEDIFFGNFYETKKVGNIEIQVFSNRQLKVDIPELNYDENNLSFYFSATSFEEKEGVMFEYMLEGFDKDWSDRTNENKKEYTNLPAGKYKFRVRSINIFGIDGEESSFSFEIIPPVWERWWFYLSEILFFMVLLVGTVYFNRSKSESKWATFLTFLVILLVFEFVNTLLDNTVDNLTGGVPVFKMAMNVSLALLLNPLENLISKLLSGKK